MAALRTHVILPEDLLTEIDELVGQRSRSAFLTDAAWTEVKRRRLLGFLAGSAPAWKEEDHPELENGAAAWVSGMRSQDAERDLERTGS